MFSDRARKTYKDKLSRLTGTDEAKLADYLHYILYFKAGARKEMDELMTRIEKYTASDIYKFSENSSTFKNFIQDPNCPLTQGWPEFLESRGFLSEAFSSLDNSMHQTIYDEYIGAYLYSEYLDKKDQSYAEAIEVLDLACGYGSFRALTERCQIYQEDIKYALAHNKEFLETPKLMEHINMLTKLYGSVGYLHAALILFNIANRYAEQQDPNLVATGDVFYQAAAENYFCGKELITQYQLPQDKKMLDAICQEAGLGFFGFKSWQSADELFLGAIDNKLMPHDKLQDNARAKLAEMLFIPPTSRPRS